MKKSKLIAALVATLAISVNTFMPVSAAKITMNGYTNPGAIGVTVLIAESSATPNTIKKSDVFWIDQQDVNADGSFSITLPEFDSSSYTLHTNAKSKLYGESKSKTVYVSSTGSALNGGEDINSPTTLEAAIKNIDLIKEIILLDNITFSGSELPGDITIKGTTSDVGLTLDAEVNLTGSLKLDNLKLKTATTFYANGFDFEITDTVTSEKRLNVYGGAKGKSVENTNITLNGGLYKLIYGGCYWATVKGNTNVTVGGNVNAGDGINDDDEDTLSPCDIFGGSYSSPVNGSTTINFTGNAIARYVVGAGNGEGGTATNTTINISGNTKVMNVYGGAAEDGSTLTCDTHINMTGGTAEALFGGSEKHPMNGNTYLTLTGGQVTRRVYTGCYNDLSLLGWDSSHFVNGTTTLTLGPDMRLNTKDGLSLGNSSNIGVFAGSRIDPNEFQRISEINTIIYLDDSYNDLESAIGEKGSYYTSNLKSNAKYVVKSSVGGKVLGTNEGGKVKIVPDEHKCAILNSDNTSSYFANDIAVLNEGDNTITFKDAFSASKTETGVSANANLSTDSPAVLIAAVYDSQSNRLISSNHTNYVVGTDSYDVNIGCTLESGKTYKVKFFLWDSLAGMKPLMNVYSITVQ